MMLVVPIIVLQRFSKIGSLGEGGGIRRSSRKSSPAQTFNLF